MQHLIFKGAPLSTNQIYRHKDNRTYMVNEGKARKEQYQWEASIQWELPIIKGDLEMKVFLYFGDKRRRDVDNYNKLLLDSMEHIVYKDDKQITELLVTKKIDVKDPRTEVFISYVEEDDES